MTNKPMILELKNGKVYGGRFDDYSYDGGGVVALYSCRLLDKDGHRWVNHDIMIEGQLVRMPYFWIAEIKDIYVVPEGFEARLDLEDILHVYIDPHYRPLKSVQCDGGLGVKHAAECDARLHEALAFISTEATRVLDKDRERRFEECFAYVRRRLLMYGAKIP